MSNGPLLLCTDLDRTLLPNGDQPESPQARGLFSRLIADSAITLVYVTGRDIDLVDAAVAQYSVPWPDYAITDVGTRIHLRDESGWRSYPDWEREIDADWHPVRRPDLAALFADIPALTLQETSKQNTHKLSYYHAPGTDLTALSTEMQRRLDASGVRASLVASIDERSNTGLLDVLPARAGKPEAIDYLREKLGLAVTSTIFAGDSGNDLAVAESAIPTVLVANTTATVRRAALELAAASGRADRLYVARGGFLGMNGNYSAGILEGLAHFHPDWSRVIEAGT